MLTPLFFLIVGILPGADAGTVQVHPVDGGQCTVETEVIQAPGMLKCRAADGEGVPLDWRDIDVVRFSDRQPARSATGWVVSTSVGDRIYGEIIGGDAKSIQLKSPILGELTLPLQQLSAMGLADTKSKKDPATRDEDVLKLAKGDILHGAVARCRKGGLVFFDGKEDRELAWPDVASIRFAVLATEGRGGLRYSVMLADDSLIVADKVDCTEGQVRLGSGLTDIRAIEFDEVVSIETLGGRRTWLRTMEPAEFKMTPYFDIRWRFERDRNILGDSLTSKGKTYARGIGLHSASRISYALEGKFERFRTLVALDDSAGPLADVDVRILLDETVLADLPNLTADDEIKVVDVLVSGGRMLTIEVGFGKNAVVQDRLNLLNAALIGK